MSASHALFLEWEAELAKPRPLPVPMPVREPAPDTKYNWGCRESKGRG